MKEFALPDDLAEIPLQGYRGSYTVLDLSVSSGDQNADSGGRSEPYIADIYVIKVNHGEERNTFSRRYMPDEALTARKIYQYYKEEVTEDEIPTDMTLFVKIKESRTEKIIDLLYKALN